MTISAIKPTIETVLDTEFAFTEVYQRYQHESPALREAHCLAVQFPAVCLPPEPDDQFVGRVRYRAVGFSPQFRYALDQYRKRETVGYYCEPGLIHERLERHDLVPDDRVGRLLDFWRGETSEAHVKARMTPAMRQAMPADEAEVVVFGYRMAGANMDFDKLLQLGIPGLRREIEQHQAATTDASADDLYTAMLMALDVLVASANYYVDLLQMQIGLEADPKRRSDLAAMADVLLNITQTAPQTLREAIQLMILYSMHANLYANYGRMDVYFGDFYVNDLSAGRLTEEEAIELLLSLWRMFPSYEGNPTGEAETRVFIGGKGRRNEANADQFALLAMEVSRRHRRPFPQLSLRWHDGMNPVLWDRALDMLGEGLTFPILYNDDVNVPAVATAFKIDEVLAERYTPFSCGEYVIQSYSFGTPNACINLAKALDVTLRNGYDPVSGEMRGLSLGSLADYATFDALYDAYTRQVVHFTQVAAEFQKLEYDVVAEDAAFLYFSMLYDHCIERGKAIFAGGVRHLGGTYETYGNITTADSLTAINTHVYDQKTITPETLMEALDADFEGYDEVQGLLRNSPKFGNDDEAADDMAQRAHLMVCHITRDQAARVGLDSYLVVVINNRTNVIWGRTTAASPDGRHAGAPLTNAHTATNGMERNGVTALLNSMVKLDPTCHAGAVHNLKFSPQMFTTYRTQLEALLDTYFAEGGTQAMITVVSREVLLKALEDPENYGHILVRTGGFSARFVDLEADIQQDIINRTLW